jgi:hypothetical protein
MTQIELLNATDSPKKSKVDFDLLEPCPVLGARIDAASVARDRAIERAEIGASEEWLAAAVAAVIRVARTRNTLTSDDCRDELAGDTREPRAWGGVMKRAAKLGVIVRTDQFVTTARVACHRRPMRVWESRIFGGEK